jgi:hypothetical protein
MTDRAIKKPVKRTAAQKKNPGGRKAVVTAATLQKLEEAFALGCTDLEACFYANIGKSTLYNYQDANPKFLERKEALKQRPVYLARKVVQVDALLDGDKTVAVKLLERHDGTKSVLAGDPDSPLQINVVERRIVRPNTAN